MKMKFDPMTGEPIQKKKKSPAIKKIVVFFAVAAVFVAAAWLVWTKVLPRIVLGKNDKIVTAFVKTFQPNQLLDAMIPIEITKGGKYTISTETETENVKVNATVGVNLPDRTISMEGDGAYRGKEWEAAVLINEGEIRMSSPMLADRIFYYSYAEKKDGYLENYLWDEEGLKLEEIDDMLQMLLSEKERDKAAKIMKEASLEALKLLEFNESDDRKVKIDGKKRSCQGYKAEVDDDLISDVCDIYEKALEECTDKMEFIHSLSFASADIPTVFKNIKRAAKNIKGDLTVYLYQNKVAAIVWKEKRQELVIEFRGGNTPWENMIISLNDSEVLKLSGSFDKKREKLKLTMKEQEILSYKYDTASGDLKLSVQDNKIEWEGNILKNAKGVTYKLKNLSANGYQADIKSTVEIRKGASSVNMGKKEIFDVGNASESEWEDLWEESNAPWVLAGKIENDIINAEELATAVNVAISDSANVTTCDKVAITSGTGFKEGTVVITDNGGRAKVKAPESKVKPRAVWVIVFDETNGCKQITLDGYEIWPTSTDYRNAFGSGEEQDTYSFPDIMSESEKISVDITHAEELATAMNVTISNSANTTTCDKVAITSGTGFKGGAVIITDNDGRAKVKAPDSRVRPGAVWVIVFDDTNGCKHITLDGYEIWPTSTAYSSANEQR